MKQTLFSMDYATQAYNIFKDHETYGQRRIQSQFIMAGNWLDHMCPEKSLDNLYQALFESEKMNVGYLMGMAHANLGICYDQLEELEKSSSHLRKSLEIYREENNSYQGRVIFNLAHVEVKQGNTIVANDLYLEGKEFAETNQKLDDLAKMELLKGLYLENDTDLVRESFKFFKERGMYADLEEYAIVAAEVLRRREKVYDALDFYRAAVEAKRLIKRSVVLDEI
ncbi:hypothetical protein HOO54_02055 [Bacillus sp. WMMC1349]|uniref:hypothetical protein n=1 Tax=Bacillus sp. WMMC1349 TaxID=2736254 RepID=UPI00155500B1|nr:hypothetical protein [Bacillus sp. WMMC1349]NPC90792.1 hypothetical protein [Bacillus sp. WMMC1349]NPC90980.1 hypothetical protein [Bacillus sp. WMMC1349]NPC91078.1 hypothetical protein [Bacillus sp. WMMC1349]